jgi:hypothetical protein
VCRQSFSGHSSCGSSCPWAYLYTLRIRVVPAQAHGWWLLSQAQYWLRSVGTRPPNLAPDQTRSPSPPGSPIGRGSRSPSPLESPICRGPRTQEAVRVQTRAHFFRVQPNQSPAKKMDRGARWTREPGSTKKSGLACFLAPHTQCNNMPHTVSGDRTWAIKRQEQLGYMQLPTSISDIPTTAVPSQ